MTARRAATIAATSIPAAIFVGDAVLGPVGAVAILGMGVAIGWKHVPGFWRQALRAALGGGLAGLLVLGPGYRLAMRVVAILDADSTPEFSVEGTIFIIVGVGAMFGGIVTLWVTLLTRAWDASRRTAATVLVLVTMASLFADSETLRELTELGAGPLVNVPMFVAVTVGWALLADRWARPDGSEREDAAVPLIEVA